MQEKLIIFLHNDNSSQPSWVIMDEHSIIKHCILQGHPEELVHAAHDKEIIVLIPSEDVLLTTVALPKMNRTRLLQALPFALEEQLTSDVDKLHFALAENQIESPLSVAVVSIDKMEEWLSLLKSWHIEADIFSPTSLALPFEPLIWHIAVHDDRALVRTGLYEGFMCDKPNLNPLLMIALSAKTEIPEMISIQYYSSQTPEIAEENVKVDVGIKVKEEMNKGAKYFSDLAHQIVKFPTINLLQGPYRIKKSKSPQKEKVYRVTAYLVITWVVLLSMYPTFSYFILKQRSDDLESQIEQIYKRQFPQASSMVAPKLRMEEKWQKLAAQVGESKLLSMLGFVGQGMSEAPGLQLKRLDFQNNQLTLEVTATSSEDIAKLTDYLAQQGLEVKQQNANLTGARMNATLVIG